MSGKPVDVLNVYHNDSKNVGQLRITPQGLGWKSSGDDARVVTFAGSDIRVANWTRVARQFQLRLSLKGGERHVFENVDRESHEPIRKAIEQFGVTLEDKDVSVKGWNWGKADVHANELAFLVQGRVSFEIPIKAISNSNMAGKNEVALDFAQLLTANGVDKNSGSSSRGPDELVEMRFYVPNRTRDGDDEGDEEEEVEVDENGDEISAAQAFHKAIVETAEIGETSGDAIVTFEQILVITPRGRFDIEMHFDHLRLHGKTYDYRVLYKHIHRQFLLPKLDLMHHQLVINLDPPLRQGQTKYPFLILQWEDTEEVDLTLNIDEEALKDRYKGLLKKEYSDPTYLVVSTLFRHLVGKEMTPPGNFSSVTGASGIKANVKAVQGELYLLEKSMLFVAKQPINIDYNKIQKALFSRIAGALRTSDMTVTLDDGDLTFTSINKDEVPGLQSFLKLRGVRVKEIVEENGMTDLNKMNLGDEDSDEESDEEDDRDRRSRVKGKAAAGSDDSEEEDEDFQASDSDGGSPAEDTDDSGAETASDDMVEEKKAASKKKASANGVKANGTKPKKPAVPTKQAKSKDQVDTDDEADDGGVMDLVSDDDDPKPSAPKKQKTA